MGGRPNYGPTAQERTKRLLEALLAYGNDELERCVSEAASQKHYLKIQVKGTFLKPVAHSTFWKSFRIKHIHLGEIAFT